MYCKEQKGEARRKEFEKHVKKCVGVNKEENTAGMEEKEHSTIDKQRSLLQENAKQKGNGKDKNRAQIAEKEN